MIWNLEKLGGQQKLSLNSRFGGPSVHFMILFQKEIIWSIVEMVDFFVQIKLGNFADFKTTWRSL